MLVFAATIFLSAFLLFQVQPLIAKFILPWFGGAPNVWTTCMLFFQLVLLGGYLYADLISRFARPKAQAIIHGICLLVSLAFLPIIPADVWRPEGTESPTLRILMLLLVSIGLPYFMLSTTGPLVQSWFGRRYQGRSPYRLFALSNAGSMLALLSFPFLFEPWLPTRGHAWGWGLGYGVFVGLCLLTMFLSLRVVPQNQVDSSKAQHAGNTGAPESVTTWHSWLWWLGLALVPSVLLLATTNHICQDVAVVPLLWIAPLSLYLLSFIICFDKPAWYRRELWGGLLAVSTILTVFCLYHGRPFGILGTTIVFLAMMFSASMICHGELALSRPGLRLLTSYYLMISLGGALGGVFVVLVAPQLFIGFYELHLSLGLAVLFGLWKIAAESDWSSMHRIGAMASLAGASLSFWGLLDTSRELEGHWPSRIGVAIALGLSAIAIFSFSSSRIPVARQELNRQEHASAKWTVIVGRLLFVLWLLGSVALVWNPGFVLDYMVPLYLIWALAVVAAAWFGRGHWFPLSSRPRVSVVVAVVLVTVLGGFLLQNATKPAPEHVHRSRNFYGLLAIKRELSPSDGEVLIMENGRVLHGFQFTRPDLRMRKTAYYGERSGIGMALSQHPKRLKNQPLKVAVIGLGTGSLAAWAQPGDTYVFYEINAKCVELAETDFYYLSENPASERTVVHTGDGRILLERQAEKGDLQNFDILIVDAFTGAGIPQHLVTEECFDLYRQHLQPDGILAFHISNAYLDLKPVIHHQGDRMNWETRIFDFSPIQSGSSTARFEDSSLWLLLSPNQEFWEQPIVQKSGARWESDWRVAWSDDFGGIWQVFKFGTPDWWKMLSNFFGGR
jgi:hypothetical protein